MVLYAIVLEENGTLRRYFYDSGICGGTGCNHPGYGPCMSVIVYEDPKFIAVRNGGPMIEVGNELITYDSLRDEPSMYGPN